MTTFSPTRELFATWVILVILGLGAMELLKNSNIYGDSQITITRKYFHLLACFIILTGVHYSPELLSLAVGGFINIFVTLEFLRTASPDSMVARNLSSYMLNFSDGKDTKDLVITHVSLLWGSAFPAIASYRSKKYLLMSGAVFLGVGDSMASFVGSLCGRTPFLGGFKTWEGWAAFVVSSFASFCAIMQFYQEMTMWSVFQVLLVSVGTGFIEVYNRSIDNFVLPFAGYLLFYATM